LKRLASAARPESGARKKKTELSPKRSWEFWFRKGVSPIPSPRGPKGPESRPKVPGGGRHKKGGGPRVFYRRGKEVTRKRERERPMHIWKGEFSPHRIGTTHHRLGGEKEEGTLVHKGQK